MLESRVKKAIAEWPAVGCVFTAPTRLETRVSGTWVWRWYHTRPGEPDMRSEGYPSRNFAERAAEELFEIESWSTMPIGETPERTVAVPKR